MVLMLPGINDEHDAAVNDVDAVWALHIKVAGLLHQAKRRRTDAAYWGLIELALGPVVDICLQTVGLVQIGSFTCIGLVYKDLVRFAKHLVGVQFVCYVDAHSGCPRQVLLQHTGLVYSELILLQHIGWVYNDLLLLKHHWVGVQFANSFDTKLF